MTAHDKYFAKRQKLNESDFLNLEKGDWLEYQSNDRKILFCVEGYARPKDEAKNEIHVTYGPKQSEVETSIFISDFREGRVSRLVLEPQTESK